MNANLKILLGILIRLTKAFDHIMTSDERNSRLMTFGEAIHI